MEPIKSQNLLSEEIKKEALKIGFSYAGIARVPGSTRLKLRTAALERWLKANHQAEMKWMEAERRKNITTLLEGVSSLIAVGLNYYVDAKRGPKSLAIARYAWGKDYHKVITKRLKILGLWLEKQRPACKWKVCVDAEPLLDKAWAEEAGLGWIGKNSNVINKEGGSWLLIGHLLCTEKLTPDEPGISMCGQCIECIKACPTQAISEPFVVDSRLCLAYHTIENKNKTIPSAIKSNLGNWVAGCDICQEVCPWNKNKSINKPDPDLIPQKWMLNLTKEQALSWTDEEWKEKLRGTALKRIKPWMWRRNVNSTTN